MVIFLNHLSSPGIRQGRSPFLPITPLSDTAAIAFILATTYTAMGALLWGGDRN